MLIFIMSTILTFIGTFAGNYKQREVMAALNSKDMRLFRRKISFSCHYSRVPQFRHCMEISILFFKPFPNQLLKLFHWQPFVISGHASQFQNSKLEKTQEISLIDLKCENVTF